MKENTSEINYDGNASLKKFKQNLTKQSTGRNRSKWLGEWEMPIIQMDIANLS